MSKVQTVGSSGFGPLRLLCPLGSIRILSALGNFPSGVRAPKWMQHRRRARLDALPVTREVALNKKKCFPRLGALAHHERRDDLWFTLFEFVQHLAPFTIVRILIAEGVK